MTISFTAIDFETANRSRGSICSVGLAKVVEGRIEETRSWLITPPDNGGFDPFNSSLHGITALDTINAPDWASSLSEILDFIGNDIVLAHNAGFDIGALRDACDFAGLQWPELNYTCTLVLARATLSLPVYKLPWVADALGISSFDHHDAGADARACALVAIALAQSRGCTSIADLLAAAGVRPGRVEGTSWWGSQKSRPISQRTPRAALVPGEINPDGPMAGEVVSFTGRISWSREDAQEMVIRNGGTCNAGKPTKKTTILVTGDYDESSLRPGMTFGSKLARAFELVEQGQKLEIMTEEDFRQRLDAQEGHRDLPVAVEA